MFRTCHGKCYYDFLGVCMWVCILFFCLFVWLCVVVVVITSLVGYFDENFYPAYYEDDDYAIRIHLSNHFYATKLENTPLMHGEIDGSKGVFMSFISYIHTYIHTYIHAYIHTLSNYPTLIEPVPWRTSIHLSIHTVHTCIQYIHTYILTYIHINIYTYTVCPFVQD